MRRLSLILTVMAVALVCLFSASHAENLAAKQVGTSNIHQAPQAHRLLIQVDQNDPALMNLALNNATNVIEYYRAKGQEVNVDVVTLWTRPAHAACRHIAGTGPHQKFEGSCIS